MNFIVTTIVGLQYGDEGKGKIAHQLSSGYDICVRFNGGPNAGHTIIYKGQKLVLHVIPSGVLAGVPVNLIGPGCVFDPSLLKTEIQSLMMLGVDISTIFISQLAHVISPYERKIDAMMNGKIGTTGKGIGPTYAHKAHRIGVNLGMLCDRGCEDVAQELFLSLSRVYRQSWLDVSAEDHEKWLESVEWILANVNIVSRDFFLGKKPEVLRYLPSGRSKLPEVLAEGAQAVMLDNAYGTYPFVTSSNCLPSAVQSGSGLPGRARAIEDVIGVFKAYCTRVGDGPFATEILDISLADKIRKAGGEYGSTTGRDRRVGWLDLDELEYAIEISGATKLYMTKADVLSSDVVPSVMVRHRGESFEFKPFDVYSPDGDGYGIHGSFAEYYQFICERLSRNIDVVSVGPKADDLIVLPTAL